MLVKRDLDSPSTSNLFDNPVCTLIFTLSMQKDWYQRSMILWKLQLLCKESLEHSSCVPCIIYFNYISWFDFSWRGKFYVLVLILMMTFFLEKGTLCSLLCKIWPTRITSWLIFGSLSSLLCTCSLEHCLNGTPWDCIFSN